MTATPLRDVQASFQDHLLDLPSAIAREIVDAGGIGVGHRLRIYHNAYRMRLIECLQDSFEKTWTYIGDAAFEAAALAYVEATPSTSRNLRWYGGSFPQWLAERFPDDGDIAELAQIDWQLRRAFDGPDGEPLAPAALAELTEEDWETVGFRFIPTLHRLPLRYNSVAIWHALDQEQAPPPAAALPAPAWLLIWRVGWEPHFRTIGAAENAALSQLLKGASFAAACTALSEQFPDEDAAALAGESLGSWLRDEMIAGLRQPDR